MKLEKVSAIAEIVSSIAIVFTLAYLAIQAQQTNNALFEGSREATMLADVNFLLTVADYPLLNAGLERELTLEQTETLRNLMAAFFRIREFTWFQKEAGILDTETWESYAATTVRLVQNERVGPIWHYYAGEFAPGFFSESNEKAGISRPRASA
jgi:hypothetical protein